MNVRREHSKNPATPSSDINQRAFSSGLWTAGVSWAARLLGLLQSVVVARLLFPEDLGLMGMAALIFGVLNVVTQTGIEAAAIYQKEMTSPVANTVWTISLVRGVFLSVLTWFSAPLVGIFFHEPRVVELVRGLAWVFLIDGFANSWIILLQKELNFKWHAILTLISESAAVGATVVAVFILRDVWGVVIGRLIGAGARTLCSFFIMPQRPHLSLDRNLIRELIGYGRHIAITNILVFLLMQADDAFVGRILGSAALGYYGLAYALSNLPATTVSQVLGRVTFPLYAKLRETPEEMARVGKRVVMLTTMLALPLSGALMLLAPDIVGLIYGEKYLAAVTATRILCLFGLIRALNSAIGAMLQVIGLPERIEKVAFFQLILMFLTIYPLSAFGIAGVSVCVTVANGFALAMLLRYVQQETALSAASWFQVQLSPITGCLLAGIPVYYFSRVIPLAHPGIKVGACFLIGAVVYAGWTWWRPQTRVEIQSMFNQIARKLRRANMNVS